MTGDPSPPGQPLGHEQFVVTEVPSDSNRPGVLTLRRVIEQYGASGEQRSPFTGRVAHYSLEEWNGRDLDSTFLAVSVRYVDPARVGTTLPVEERHKLVRVAPSNLPQMKFDFR